MLFTLKGELIKKKLDPICAIVEAIGCSERTARNKLKGVSPFTIPEAIQILNKYFKSDNVSIEQLFTISA